MPKLTVVQPQAAPDGAAIEALLEEDAGKDLLRFLTCGSVDDGKSTLIGRLLYDSQVVYDDQLAAIGSGKQKKSGAEPDLALLVDGLQAEREQGITIDVAYRYFASAKRKFIVADTPGHEQYTRNMATGASTCDFAVVLVDARKGIVTQTRRHCCILNLLGIRKIALAVNKMDLVDFSKQRFEEISTDFADFTQALGFEDVVVTPVSAVQGDNVLNPSGHMDWYHGPTLMAHLETVDATSDRAARPFRMPVQWVNRPDSDFRGFAGTITGGTLRKGDRVIALPGGKSTIVERIVTFDGDHEEAHVGDAVTLTFADEVDISRGDVLCDPDNEAEISDQLAAHVIWMDRQPMLPGRKYILKSGSQQASASISTLKYKLNVDNLEHQAGKNLDLNEVGYCNLSLDRPLVFDAYRNDREMGGFILVDRLTNMTVGAGMIEFGLRRATNIQWQKLDIDKAIRAEQKGQKPCVLWFTGLSGSGKSTVANLLEKQLHATGRHTYVLDGDNVRHGLNKDLGFTDADRVENIRRVAETAKLFVDAGLIVMVSFISPFRSERRMARELFAEDEFLEVFVDTPLDVCEARDPKGLYKKARAGEIKNFTGIDSAYEVPVRADIILEGGKQVPDDLVADLISSLQKKGFI
ncbi:MAG: sulfate adenylyltransferase subunit CysN [Hyphomicrobiaceae bacterium]|nr:sulfate adenylyltransferase subunit CysN [Hyphomicrobiaceae bacterium]